MFDHRRLNRMKCAVLIFKVFDCQQNAAIQSAQKLYAGVYGFNPNFACNGSNDCNSASTTVSLSTAFFRPTGGSTKSEKI